MGCAVHLQQVRTANERIVFICFCYCPLRLSLLRNFSRRGQFNIRFGVRLEYIILNFMFLVNENTDIERHLSVKMANSNDSL